MHASTENTATGTISATQLGLLHHTLGLAAHQRGGNRNYFLAGPRHSDHANLQALVAAGLMSCSAAPSWVGSGDLYRATETGRQYAGANLPSMPAPVKRSKYQKFLYADCGLSFAEWLGIEVPRREYMGYRYSASYRVRLVSSKTTGEWGATVKEAKALYKKAQDSAKVVASSAGSHPSSQPV